MQSDSPDIGSVRTATTRHPNSALRFVISQSGEPSRRPTSSQRRFPWRLGGTLVVEGRRLEPRLENRADKDQETAILNPEAGQQRLYS